MGWLPAHMACWPNIEAMQYMAREQPESGLSPPEWGGAGGRRGNRIPIHHRLLLHIQARVSTEGVKQVLVDMSPIQNRLLGSQETGTE